MKTITKHFIDEIEWIDSIVGLVGVCLILGGALFFQLFEFEAPCPLCLLQRAAFVSLGISLLMNIRYGNKVSHWAMGILSSCVGIAVSIRQILLHITSTKGFGSEILGMHMYTWCFMAFAAAIVGCTLMLLIYPEKRGNNNE